MGWVVKELRTGLTDAIRQDAERDARRIRRVAGRTAGRVADDLRELEALAVELHATVRRQRLSAVAPAPGREMAAARVAPAPDRVAPAARGAEPAAQAATAAESAAAPRRRRPGRASMRSSPLADLLRASGGGGRFPRALLDARS
jgi:hypothetical protein